MHSQFCMGKMLPGVGKRRILTPKMLVQINPSAAHAQPHKLGVGVHADIHAHIGLRDSKPGMGFSPPFLLRGPPDRS